MKYLNKLIFLIIVLNTNAYTQGWVLHTNRILSVTNDLHFVNKDTGWVACSNGRVAKTIDGGTNWYSIFLEGTKNLMSVFFINSTVGWVAGYDGNIYKTMDSGENWCPQVSGTTSALYSVCFANTNTGWAGGTDFGSNGIIIKTTNGGKDWFEQQYPSVLNIFSIYCMDTSTAWAVGGYTSNLSHYKIFLRTTDGGSSWFADCGKGEMLSSVIFVNKNVGWAVGIRGQIFKTTDGGINWAFQTGAGGVDLWSVDFVDENIGWIVGDSGFILKTKDGGSNWFLQESGTDVNLKSVFFIDANTGWVIGNEGTILKTTSGGETAVEDMNYSIPMISSKFVLFQNYPNPFNPETTISYQLPKACEIVIKINNIKGQLVKTVIDQWQYAGYHLANWNGKDNAGKSVTSGVYFYQLQTKDFVQTNKMVLMQ